MTLVTHASLHSFARAVALLVWVVPALVSGCKKDSRARESVRTIAREVRGTRVPPQPSAPRIATITLDESRSVARAIGPRGGSLSMDLATGGRVTLTIPRGALIATTRVRMIPITNATGLPLGGGIGGGIQLEPEGLVLFRPATLAFERMTAPTQGRPRVVAWFGRGSDVHRRPHRTVAGNATVQLAHFSGFAYGGETEADARTESGRAPANPEARAHQSMPDVASVPPGQGMPSDPGRDESARRAAEALEAWWNESLHAKLLAAQSDDTQLEGAVAEYLSWWTAVAGVGLDEWFRGRQQQALDLLADGLRNGIRVAYDHCRQNHAIEEVATMVTWLGTAQMLGLSGRGGLGYGENRSKLEECLRMKLDTNLLIRYGGSGDDVRIEAELSVDQLALRTSGEFVQGGIVVPPFEATGPLHYRRFEVDLGDEDCRAVDLEHSDGQVEISVEFDVNLRAPTYGRSMGGSSGGRPAPPPIPYANIGMTPCAAASDGFTVACEGQVRVPMRTQLVTTATYAASQGDESGTGTMTALAQRQPAGARLFQVRAVMAPTMEGEPIHMELTHELTQGH